MAKDYRLVNDVTDEMPNVPVDRSKSEKPWCWCKVFTVKNKTTYYKTPASRVEFGLAICPLKRPLVAEGILILIN